MIFYEDDRLARAAAQRASGQSVATTIIALLESRREYQMALAFAKRMLLAGPSLTMSWDGDTPNAGRAHDRAPDLSASSHRPSRPLLEVRPVGLDRTKSRLRFASARALKRRRVGTRSIQLVRGT